MRTWRGAMLFVLICQAAGALGVLTTETGTSAWYRELAKPSFQPPGWVFGPVWTALYALMGVAVWRIWRLASHVPGRSGALFLFWLQLGLNAAWTPVFFGAHLIDVALAILLALWGVLMATWLAFRRLDGVAAALLVPYLAWALFASILNGAIYALN